MSSYGDHNGKTFPDGSGNMDPIIVNGDDLVGTGALVTAMTHQDGSDQLSGTFILSILGDSTAPLRYDADAATFQAAPENIDGIGDISVSSSLLASKRVNGVVAYINRDDNIATIAPDASEPEGLRWHVSPGTYIHIQTTSQHPSLIQVSLMIPSPPCLFCVIQP